MVKMAFSIFKKKEEQFPSAEKAEVLGEELPELPEDIGELPELPELPEGELPELPGEEEMAAPPSTAEFEAGFRKPTEMRPPIARPREARLPAPPTWRPPAQEALPAGPFEPVTATTRVGPARAPHVYIRVSKYKEVLDAIHNLRQSIENTKQDLEDLDTINKDEDSKLKESADVVLKIEELLNYLETTFSQPEE
jgi:hypothetical protein